MSPPSTSDVLPRPARHPSLLPAVAHGHPDAVSACVRQFTPHLWNLARGILRNAHDIEDAIQDVFVELWRVAGRYDPDAGSELTFVLTIARRRFIDRARRHRRTPMTEGDPSLEGTASRTIADPVELRDEVDRVAAAFALLRPEHRTILEQALLQGRTHVQIAERTGLPIGTVKSHARRGLMKLRQTLGVVVPDDTPADSPPEEQ